MAILFSFAVPVMAANNSLAFDMEALGITAGMKENMCAETNLHRWL